MEHGFWLERWEQKAIGFHQRSFNRLLIKHWGSLGIPKGETAFVPLCGKSRDMLWLADSGYRVVGNELSDIAVREFFSENGMPGTSRDMPPFKSYESGPFQIYAGDNFLLTTEHIGNASAVFDRAALIALPEPMRSEYVAHQRQLLPAGCVILLISLEYDPALVSPPPFDIRQAEIEQLYGAWCEVEHLETIAGNIKGTDGFEAAYRLTVQ